MRDLLPRIPILCLLLPWSWLAGCDSPVLGERPAQGQICEVSLGLQAAALAEQQAALSQQALEPGEIAVASWGPARLFPGGRLFLLGRHLDGEPGEPPLLRLRGRFDSRVGAAVEIDDVLTGEALAAGSRVEFPLDAARLAAWGIARSAGQFSGDAILFVPLGDSRPPLELPLPRVEFELVPELRPTLTQLTYGVTPDTLLDVYPEDHFALVADDLLLPGEGTVELVLQGDVQRGGGTRHEDLYTLPVRTATKRNEGTLVFAADAFGILPGTLRGQATLRLTTSAGQVWQSDALPVRLSIDLPVVAGLDPPAASRGQWVSVFGRGFLPQSDRGGTLFRLDGRFSPDDGTAPVELRQYEISPDEWLDNSSVRTVFRTEVTLGAHGERILTGLVATPGHFDGTITPIIDWERSEVAGVPFEGGFDIAPSRQLVYLKYLPGFTVSLNRTWGLRSVERELRDRILEVVRRDYDGINVVFTEERPDDFHEFEVIEIGGLDPNGQGLFGLDNTTGEDEGSPKDVRNLRLQEVIGGRNARAEEQGYLAYGGVFLESFRQFSTRLPEPIVLASSRFDEVFEDLAPFLCGSPVEPEEYPGGPRQLEIAEAIRVLGSLIGNTISHEVGHSLGLSLPYGPPNEFHNLFDSPNAMMDGGQARPFEERAELDGQGPGVFEAENRLYLQEILPMQRP